ERHDNAIFHEESTFDCEFICPRSNYPGETRRVSPATGSSSQFSDKLSVRAESWRGEFRRQCPGSPADDGIAEDHFPSTRSEWRQPPGNQLRQLRRIQGESVPRTARPPAPQKRAKGYDTCPMVEPATR